MKKDNLIFFIPVGIFLFFTIAVFAFVKTRNASPTVEPTPKPKKKISKPINEIPYEQRPYVFMTPTVGREIEVTVATLPKPADAVEVEPEYQYGTTLGGSTLLIDLSDGLPATKEFALYSRSAGGKTSYEEDVKGGTLRLMFQGDDEYWLEQEWNYFDRINAKSSTQESDITSRDDVFEISGSSLRSARYVIIYNSPGLPNEFSSGQERLSEVYAVQMAGVSNATDVSVSFELDEANDSAQILGWDGTNWEKLETEVSDTIISATSDLMEAYVVVKE